jgi:thiamine pyrophosphate-dependent acetolactate synthase large subunit-like protein
LGTATARSGRTRWSSKPRCGTNCPLLCVISLNGGWTADPERNKLGCDLGYTRYDKMAEALGCYAEYVEEPEGIRPALQRAWRKVEEAMVGFVNVKTDYRARVTTVLFSSRET